MNHCYNEEGWGRLIKDLFCEQFQANTFYLKWFRFYQLIIRCDQMVHYFCVSVSFNGFFWCVFGFSDPLCPMTEVKM
jgi:hypothetical protein